MWQCESCSILVPAARDQCPRGHDRPPAVPEAPLPVGTSAATPGPRADVHNLGPLPPPFEPGQAPDRQPTNGSAPPAASPQPNGFEPPPVFEPYVEPNPANYLQPEPVARPMPVPRSREEVGGLYFALRLSAVGEPSSSVRYPILDIGGAPVLWDYEEPSSASSTVDALGSNVHDLLRRHEGGARVILTNRRLIVVSTAAPANKKGWQDAWDSEPRPQRSDRLMGHALWEWVSQVQCREPVDGPSVEVVMSTKEGDSPRFVLSFAARGSISKQRAEHLAGSIVDIAAEFKGETPQQQGSTWFFNDHLPVGEVR